ncbi:hypothetical protein AOL_s00043g277 [Orbilia oligospora ATCC 24927]|uniref:Uncharacterized protein n=1 Tax=Arthrobotrys oligospora (strain ATCC 24927 / CBS 115.81 / DSM 1491) TaxID=756982 RepID=G1X3K4_ARTOA|nr:hypothetical protein AOL_s00043g277 [Orbilia oligospora ATCC 24927]EGX52488.1 hypothetical protein AOL_s00043g277 [Orbilia oligospora ATCC 24927]
MSGAVQPQEAITVTRGGQVVVIIPSIKTKEVGATSQSTHAKETTLEKTSVSPVVPTTLVTSVRTQTPPPVIIVTQVITITKSPPLSSEVSTSLSTERTSTAFTRAQESRPAGIPFPDGPLGTTEGTSPLETGGVHVPQEQFNGLAASPGIIAGSFAGIIVVGLLLCLGCWLRRKGRERRIKMAGAHPGSLPPRAPVLPPIKRYMNSPIWFGKKTKAKATALKNLRAASAGVVTNTPSATTTPQTKKPKSPLGVIGNVSRTQPDPKRDILSTDGATTGGRECSPRLRNEDLEMGLEKENRAPAQNHDTHKAGIGMAITEGESSTGKQDCLKNASTVDGNKQQKHRLQTIYEAPAQNTGVPEPSNIPSQQPNHQQQYTAYPGGAQY